MNEIENEKIIAATKKWVADVVVGLNFCPFAAKEVRNNTIEYVVDESENVKDNLQLLLQEFQKLDNNKAIETSIIIYKKTHENFDSYLDFVEMAEEFLVENNYEGIYQIASFHPNYCFAGSTESDPANYTNRSIYTMLHILREESLENAIDKHPNTEKIPADNIKTAHAKGLAFMQNLRNNCTT